MEEIEELIEPTPYEIERKNTIERVQNAVKHRIKHHGVLDADQLIFNDYEGCFVDADAVLELVTTDDDSKYDSDYDQFLDEFTIIAQDEFTRIMAVVNESAVLTRQANKLLKGVFK